MENHTSDEHPWFIESKKSFEDGVKDTNCLYAPFDQCTANRPLAHTYLRGMNSE